MCVMMVAAMAPATANSDCTHTRTQHASSININTNIIVYNEDRSISKVISARALVYTYRTHRNVITHKRNKVDKNWTEHMRALTLILFVVLSFSHVNSHTCHIYWTADHYKTQFDRILNDNFLSINFPKIVFLEYVERVIGKHDSLWCAQCAFTRS